MLPHELCSAMLESLCSSDQSHPQFTPARRHALKRSIGFHAHILSRSGTDAIADREDVEQELIMKVLDATKRIDPSRGTATAYLKSVVVRHSATMRCRVATSERCLAGYRRRSPPSTGSSVSDDELTRSAWELREDVLTILGRLGAEDRDLAGRLMRLSVAEVARQLGVARSTLRDRIRSLEVAFGALRQTWP